MYNDLQGERASEVLAHIDDSDIDNLRINFANDINEYGVHPILVFVIPQNKICFKFYLRRVNFEYGNVSYLIAVDFIYNLCFHNSWLFPSLIVLLDVH